MTIYRQVEEHKKLQVELEKQQEKVASLQNMVVIVEDGVQDDSESRLFIYIYRMLYDILILTNARLYMYTQTEKLVRNRKKDMITPACYLPSYCI